MTSPTHTVGRGVRRAGNDGTGDDDVVDEEAEAEEVDDDDSGDESPSHCPPFPT